MAVFLDFAEKNGNDLTDDNPIIRGQRALNTLIDECAAYSGQVMSLEAELTRKDDFIRGLQAAKERNEAKLLGLYVSALKEGLKR